MAQTSIKTYSDSYIQLFSKGILTKIQVEFSFIHIIANFHLVLVVFHHKRVSYIIIMFFLLSLKLKKQIK